MFRDVPPQTLQGLRFKKGRSVSQGTCFAHAHQGNYSRDELGKRSSKKSDETHVPVTTPDREFMRGRNWPDVRSGKFRKDSTSGLSGLFNRRGFTDVGREQIKENTETRPAPNHGFSILGLEVVQVAVRRGVARAVGVNQHPCLKKNPDFENTHRWSGNAFLEEAIGNGEDRNSKQTEARTQATPKAPSFVRIRVRLTCDEEDAPWCVRSSKKSDETHVPVTTPDREFMRGRNWPDVRSGKFRKDSTSGLSGLFNRRGFTDVGREQIKENTETRPAPNHGFSILGLEVVQVAVRRGVARAVGVNQHPCLKKNPDFENTHRWSGNAFLEEAIGNGEDRNSKQTEARTQATPKAPSFVRIRVRLTCDEEDAPWCVDETRVGAADGFRV